MRFKKILLATDFSTGSRHALRVAVRIARETGAELVIAHAWYIPAIAYSLEAPFPATVEQSIVDDLQRALDASVSEAIADGAPRVSGTMLTGIPWVQIVDELERQPYDLCVIGTHGRTGLTRVLLGSVAEMVVRHAPCSVLAVRANGEPQPFQHVLVPTDFSPSAAFALDLAPHLVSPSGAITLLHVIELPVAFAGEVPITDFANDLDQRAVAALEAEAERGRRATERVVRTKTRIGRPGAQTLSAIDHDDTIDLVVMGSHGRTGFKRALMGSVAEKVVRHARCPVLVARKRA